MVNVTESIPDDLLELGWSDAQSRGTTFNALISELLDDTISNSESAVDSMIDSLIQSAGDYNGVKIHREELHCY